MIIRFAGFGGQGIVLSSYILGQSAIFDGKKAIQNQAYGSESRGGECRGDVIISADDIYELEPDYQDVLVAMAQPAYEKFVPLLRREGTLIIDKDLIVTDAKIEPVGITRYGISATDIAFKNYGRKIMANMVMLGYLNTILGLVRREAMEEAISRNVPRGSAEINLQAFAEGITLAGREMKKK